MNINVNIKDAAKILFINSVLSVDKNNVLLKNEEIREANAKLEGENTGTPIQSEVKRAEFLIKNIKNSVPWLCRASQNMSTFSWKIKMIFVIIFAFLGAGFHFFENRDTFHVFSISLFGLLIWNFISIFILIISPFLIKSVFSFFKKKKIENLDSNNQSNSIWIEAIVDRLQKTYQWLISKNTIIGMQETANKALIEFMNKWRKLIGKVLKYEYLKTIHLSMISFTTFAIIAAFINGLNKSHTISTDSDFLTSSHFMSILKFIFIPSRIILGELPDISILKDNTNSINGSATPWILHYIVTLIIFVIIPRLILLFWTSYKSYHLKLNFPIPKDLIFRDTLNIALASHTNIGKTSLLRTLLKRDVGEVSNKENVTQKSAGYFLLNEQNARLKIWDTPGFNNVENLINKIQQNNLDKFLIKYRRKDKLNVEALSALKNESDLILFLIPAQPDSNLKNTIIQELTILKKLNKPVLYIVNRLEKDDHKKNEDSLNDWKEVFLKYNIPNEYVLPLDAHNRTMEDEELFFKKIVLITNSETKELAEKIHKYYKEKKESQLRKLSIIISDTLIELCEIYEKKSDKKSLEQLKKRSDIIIIGAIEEIIKAIGLDHSINKELTNNIIAKYKTLPFNDSKSFSDAVKGGAITGVTAGATTALIDGGFGLVGGLIIGAIAGGIGSFIISFSYKEIKYKGSKIIIWDEEFIKNIFEQLIKNRLTISEYGRARGKVTNDYLISVNEIFEKSAKDTLAIHWKNFWEDIKLFQKQNDKSKIKKLFSKLWNSDKNNIVDKSIIQNKCREILNESNRNCMELKKVEL